MKLLIFFIFLLILNFKTINVNGSFSKNSNKNIVGFYSNYLKNKTINNYKSLGKLCQEGNYDTIVIGSLTWSLNVDIFFFDTCFSNSLNQLDTRNPTNEKCEEMGNDIQTCQKSGVNIIIQIGGSNYYNNKINVNIVIKNKLFAKILSKKVYDLFLFGKDHNTPRPFGDDIFIDGIDLSPMLGKSEGYLDLANELNIYRKQHNFFLTSTVDCSLLHSNKEGLSVPTSILHFQYFDFITLDFVHNKECDYWSKVSDQWIIDYTQFTVKKTLNQTKLLLMASSNPQDSAFFSPKFFLMEYTKYCIHLPNMAGVYLSDILFASKIVNSSNGLEFSTEISKSIKYYDPTINSKPQGSRPPCSYTNTC